MLLDFTNLSSDDIDESDQTLFGVFTISLLVEITNEIGWRITRFNKPTSISSTSFDTQITSDHGRNLGFKWGAPVSNQGIVIIVPLEFH